MRQSDLRTFDRMQTPADAVARWQHQAGSLQSVSESQNFVYRFQDPLGRVRYLRIGNAKHRTPNEVAAELDFIKYLGDNGLEVARPVASAAGNLVESIETPAGGYCAVVFEQAPGERVAWGTDAQNRKYLFERGVMLGQMHRLSEKYFVTGPRRWEWFEDELFTDPAKFLPESEVAVRREYEKLVQWMLKRPRKRENYGMIHGDFGTFNTLRLPDGRLSIFDFDDCSFHWFLYDVAVSLRSARKLPDKYRKAYARVLLEGYATERNLNGDGLEELSRFCQLSALYRFVGTIRHNLGEQEMSPQQKQILDQRRLVVVNPPDWH